MKTLILISSILFTFTFQASAQDKQADINTLFELMRSDKMVDAMIGNYSNAMKSFASQNLSKENETNHEEKFNEFMGFLTREMTSLSHNLMGDMQALYDKYFTHEEIKELIIFYKSPVGQKILDKTPEISKEIMDITLQKYMPDFQVKMEKYMQENILEEEIIQEEE